MRWFRFFHRQFRNFFFEKKTVFRYVEEHIKLYIQLAIALKHQQLEQKFVRMKFRSLDLLSCSHKHLFGFMEYSRYICWNHVRL